MYDLIVVGLGVYGSAIAAEACDKGLQVLAVDQFRVPHTHGSSHGGSRIHRLTTVESDEYVPIARRASEIWKMYDSDANGDLLVPTGFALIAKLDTDGQAHHGVTRLFERAQIVAERHGIPHDVMFGSDFAKTFPALELSPHDRVFYEHDAFVIKPEVAISTMLGRASKTGRLKLVTGYQATDIEITSAEISVKLDGKKLAGKQAVLCTGPWQHDRLLGRNVIPITIRPQFTLHLSAGKNSAASQFPSFIYLSNERPLVYGIPAARGIPEVKIGLEQDSVDVSRPGPEFLPAGFMDKMVSDTGDAIKSLLPSLDMRHARSKLCYYSVTDDSKHVIKRLANGRITLVAACSGHGFKYAPAVAERIVGDLY